MYLTTRVASAVVQAFGEASWRALAGRANAELKIPSPTFEPTPRRTTSACPWCHAEALQQVLDGTMDEGRFEERSSYLIPAEIVHRDGQIWMRKTCAKHGIIEDMVSSDAAFTARIESLYRPQDPDRKPPQGGRRSPSGLMLVVDLTNRCNMKCSPCFRDANHHDYVREATVEDVRRILERAAHSGTGREFDVLFSGGEPTVTPIFLECVGLAKSLGFSRVHVATNGIRFAQEDGFAASARDAGLYGVFLQFDGTSNQSNRHRGISNPFDVKLAALDRIHSAGFQPLVFTGRDAVPSDEDRDRRRYTLTHLAHDLGTQSAFDWQPLRDWFPISVSGAFGNLLDHLGVDIASRSPAHDLHATHGQFSFLLVDTATRRATPLSAFFSVERFIQDATAISRVISARRARTLLVASILRNLSLERAPKGLTFISLGQLFRQLAGRLKNSMARQGSNASSRWRFLAVHAVWFEDPFNVDFEAVCRSCAPVATEEGEFSFCAYNSMGWRQIVEQKHRTASLSDWHRRNGRHTIYANGATVPLDRLTMAGPSPTNAISRNPLPEGDRIPTKERR